MYGVAIDAGWLRDLDTLSHSEFLDAIAILNEFVASQVPILLDTGGRIQSEYARVLLERTPGRRFFSLQMSRGLFDVHSGEPTKSFGAALSADGFDLDDLPYVAVAQKARGVFLTNEVKHLTVTRKQIAREHGLEIVDTPRVRELLRKK